MAEHGVETASLSRNANAQPGSGGRGSVQEALLVCGIVASLLYVAMMEVIRYGGYSATSQTVSELSAIGAPTRNLWFWLSWLFTTLVFAFGWGVWKSAGRKRSLVVWGCLLLAFRLLGVVW